MEYIVTEAESGARFDVVLSQRADVSRSRAAGLIGDGDATLNGKAVDKKTKLCAGDVIFYIEREPALSEAMPENIPLDIVYEDEDIIVINKPSGLVVHPAAGNPTGTLVNALLYHCGESLSGIGGVLRPGIVHRIDKDTSGLLVVAKNDAAHRALAAQLEDHSLYREYHALIKGGMRTEEGTVSLPIGRHPVDRKKMAVIRDGSHPAKEAVTHYKVVKAYGDISYLSLRLETGRTHQIRVHMAAIGHPLLGDEVYGKVNTPFEKRHAALFDGQALHAKRLSFLHPKTAERVSFECPLPPNFEKLLEILDMQTDS